jgi:hypothetical protein
MCANQLSQVRKREFRTLYQEQLNKENNWACFIKNMLVDLGLGHVWDNQSTFTKTALLKVIKSRLRTSF